MDHSKQEVLSLSAEAASQALLGLRDKSVDREPVVTFLGCLLALTPDHARQGFRLDMLLGELIADDERAVRAFLAKWFETHARSFITNHADLNEVLPLVAHKLGPEKEVRWWLDFLVAGSLDLRLVAQSFLSAHKTLPDAAISALSQQDAEIVLHELVGSGALGPHIVSVLLRFASRFPSLLPEADKILCTEIAPNYPKVCEEAVQRVRAGAQSQPESQPLEATASNLEAAVKRLFDAHALRARVPEIVRVAPAATAWALAEQRLVDTAYRRARGRSPLLSLVTTTPIGRGSSTVMPWGPHPVATALEGHSFSMVLPVREVIDPLGERLRRMAHLKHADELRKARGGTP